MSSAKFRPRFPHPLMLPVAWVAVTVTAAIAMVPAALGGDSIVPIAPALEWSTRGESAFGPLQTCVVTTGSDCAAQNSIGMCTIVEGTNRYCFCCLVGQKPEDCQFVGVLCLESSVPCGDKRKIKCEVVTEPAGYRCPIEDCYNGFVTGAACSGEIIDC